MICVPTQAQCEKDTVALLKYLDKGGHKASLSKLQFVQQELTFLGRVITSEGKSLYPKRINAIQNIPKLITKKQVMSFLGMCSYCRSFIPNYAVLESPLSAIAHGRGLQAHSEVTNCWSRKSICWFDTCSPNDSNSWITWSKSIFHADCRWKDRTSVLLQDNGGRQRPIAYFSTKLDPVAAGLPTCLRAVAAAEKAVMASRDIVGYSDLTYWSKVVPHAVSLILLQEKTSHLCAARWLCSVSEIYHYKIAYSAVVGLPLFYFSTIAQSFTSLFHNTLLTFIF